MIRAAAHNLSAMQRLVGCGALALCALGLPACAPSEADVKHDFMKLVAASNTCQSADECTVVSVGCPLGCGVAVNRNQAARVQKGGEDLIADYERYGRACAYDCITQQQLVCVAQRCAFDDAAPTPDAGTTDDAR
jgi:hypothetical protein